MKIILFLLALGLLKPAPIDVSDWVLQPTEGLNCKIYYSATLKTSKWIGYPDANYVWDGDGLSWEREVIDEDGKKQTVKTYKQLIEIIADLKIESRIYGIEDSIEQAVVGKFGGPLKGFIWLDKVTSGGAVLLPFTAGHIFIATGNRLNPTIMEITDNPLEANYYQIVDGKTRVFVTGFSGMGGAAGAPPNLIAHYRMNENTAGDNAELVTNGTFAAWDSVGARVEDPTDWIVSGESGTDPEISEVGTGEGHGGAGTGMCNIYTSDGTLVSIAQDIPITIGRKYRVSIDIDTVVLGKLKIYDLQSQWVSKELASTGTHTLTFVAIYSEVQLRVERTGPSSDVTFDNISIKFCAIEDSSGNDHDGMAQQDSDAISVAGVVKTAFDFDGSSDYIIVPDHDDFTPAGTPFSISAWVNMDDATNFVIASKGVEGTDGEWRFYTDASDKLIWHSYDESINKYIGRKYNTTALSENQWLHLVATADGGILSSSIKLYLDGSQVDDTDDESVTFVAIENLTQDVWIGNYNGTYANGTIDNVYFFAAELTQDEVNILYNGGAGTEIPAELDQVMSPRRANLSPFSLRRRYEY